MECAICHRTFPSNADCENGHFVCDGCHSSGADSVTEVCLGSSSKDPLEILTTLMRSPGVHMHGPEHHVLVGSALLAAYRNAGGDVDLPFALRELKARGSQVPGGGLRTVGLLRRRRELRSGVQRADRVYPDVRGLMGQMQHHDVQMSGGHRGNRRTEMLQA